MSDQLQSAVHVRFARSQRGLALNRDSGYALCGTIYENGDSTSDGGILHSAVRLIYNRRAIGKRCVSRTPHYVPTHRTMHSLLGLTALLASARAVLAGSLPDKIYGVNIGGWYVPYALYDASNALLTRLTG